MSVLEKQLVAVEAQIDILKAMVAAIRRSTSQETARIELPAQCAGYKAEDCGRQCDEGVNEMGGMGGSPRVLMCRGCGETLPAA